MTNQNSEPYDWPPWANVSVLMLFHVCKAYASEELVPLIFYLHKALLVNLANRPLWNSNKRLLTIVLSSMEPFRTMSDIVWHCFVPLTSIGHWSQSFKWPSWIARFVCDDAKCGTVKRISLTSVFHRLSRASTMRWTSESWMPVWP